MAATKIPTFDLDSLSPDEATMLAEVLKVNTLEQLQARFAEIKPGHTPIPLMKPLLWLARRQDDPSFTFEQAGSMPLTQLIELVASGSVAKSRPALKRKSAK